MAQSSLIESYGLSLAVIVIISAFSGIAWYICINLNIKIWFTFKKYKSLYFWALIISSWSTFLTPTCYLLKDFQVGDINAIEALSTIAWYGMVTGQSIVLYSRLHLVVIDRQKIRWVLYMIIINVFVLHIPTTILTYGSHIEALKPRFEPVYAIYEKIQLTGFFLQEVTISGLYIWETRRILKAGVYIYKTGTQGVMRHLIRVNIFIVLLNLCLLSTEYANLFQVQTVFKAAVYSIKLDLEFFILNQLRIIAASNRTSTLGQPPRDTTTGARGEEDNVGMNMNMHVLKSNHSESNHSTAELFDRQGNPTNPGRIVKVTEISVERLRPNSGESEEDSIEELRMK